ncbi:GroES-like protein [Gymnopus androsaceus JB14]|uniref:GroES-like protein n=1 Tax=Gymnopus androsaceus JB14 TaxID=1447944 RepID=A0A6A4GLH5_9AGAR|nr:GroES-like protein [Gymnopus androsaceus JB14]
MKSMLAICTRGEDQIELRRIPIPKPGPRTVLIRVMAAAQNPSDWKTVMNHNVPDCVVGCEFAGVVVELGENVETDIHLMDRVASIIHGSTSANGAFAEYLVAHSHMLIHIPDSLSFEQGAQVPLGCFTACQTLYQSQFLPFPTQEFNRSSDILVWGGSSMVGHYTIQFAKLGGMRVIATASPLHFQNLKDLGVDKVFDYRNPKAGQKIHAYTDGKLTCAVDCISERTTPYQVSEALSNDGGVVSAVNPYISRKKDVKVISSLAYWLMGQPFNFPEQYTPSVEHVEFASKASRFISQMLDANQLVLAPIKVMPHGLASVPDGFDYMKAGKVSKEKIIYRISDTPGI